jgi:hypothetical protein
VKCVPHDANQTCYCQVSPPYLPVRFNTASRIEPYTSARRDRERPGRARWQGRHASWREIFYRWRRKYGRLRVSETRHLRALEEENRRLERVAAMKRLICKC